ncbi:MAG TPA: hypothetical protein VGB13_12290, partial [Candidatus Krumholzibacteria bacterium]
MPGPNRKAYLKQIVAEYIEAGVAAEHWSAIVDKLLEDGHITTDELARDYGRDGFQRTIIRKVQTERDNAGRDKYVVTKSGGIKQMEFSELEDCRWVYYTRKHHVDASQRRLGIYRQQVIDHHGVDPE